MKRILIRPIITEKSMFMANKGWYTFEVESQSQKPEIAKAVEQQFEVKVKGIKTISIKGKPQRTGKKRIEIATSRRKKAMVKLDKDQKIELFNFSETAQK